MQMEVEVVGISVVASISAAASEPSSAAPITGEEAALAVVGCSDTGGLGNNAACRGEAVQACSPSQPAACAHEGDNVILDENGEHQWSVKLRQKSKIKVGKAYVLVNPLIDAPWGTVFKLSADGQSLEAMTNPPEVDGFKAPEVSERDNSTLLDRNDANQSLSAADIAEMRRSGKAGADIIDALVTSSATFATKTEFSQDKYKRKKAKKYCVLLTMRRPTARALCQMHYDKGPDRVWNLRFDTLAVMLSLANVAAGAQVLVLESCQGVVTAAVTERLGGYGTCVAAHVDAKFYAPLDAAKEMNLTPQERAVVRVATLGALLGAKDDLDAETRETAAAAAPAAAAAATAVAAAQPPSEGAGQVSSQAAATTAPASTAIGGGEVASVPAGTGGTAAGRQPDARQAAGFTASAAELPGLVASGFGSVLLAAPKLHPGALLSAVWPLVAPSASIVIYSCWPQPLAELYTSLQHSRQAVLVQMHESWMRPHQVLPMRTHPEMSCSGTGGYILSATKVAAEDDARPVWTPPAATATRPAAASGTSTHPAQASAVAGVAVAGDVQGTEQRPALVEGSAAEGHAGQTAGVVGGIDVGAEMVGGQGGGERGRGRGGWGRGRGGGGGGGKRHGDQRGGGGGGKRGRR